MNSTAKELLDAGCLAMRIWSVVIGIAALASIFLTLAR